MALAGNHNVDLEQLPPFYTNDYKLPDKVTGRWLVNSAETPPQSRFAKYLARHDSAGGRCLPSCPVVSRYRQPARELPQTGVQDMDRSYLRATRDAEAQLIVKSLQRQQFIRPHQAIATAVNIVAQEMGICQATLARALAWLQINAQLSIGRMRQSEIFQLARTLQRFWRQNALRSGSTVPNPSPVN